MKKLTSSAKIAPLQSVGFLVDTFSVTLFFHPTVFFDLLPDEDDVDDEAELRVGSSIASHRLCRSGAVHSRFDRPVGGRVSASRSRKNESALR